MKGQMFIITMVFLVGLIFAVQNSLSQYSFLNLADAYTGNELALLTSVRQSFRDTLAGAFTCEEAGPLLLELESFLERRPVAGKTVEIDQALDCRAGELDLTIRIRYPGGELADTIIITPPILSPVNITYPINQTPTNQTPSVNESGPEVPI